jgi:hypothetical protein
MTDEPGTELVAIETPSQLAAFLAGMTEAPEPTPEEQAAIRLAIVQEMLESPTEADLWRELPTWSSKEAVGRVFMVTGPIRGIRSKFVNQDGVRGAYLSCRAVDVGSGELGIFNTSAMRLCGRIGWYYQHGRLPVTLEIVKRGETADGYPILDAELVETVDTKSK